MHFFVLIVLSASFASYTYTVDVDRSGFASVTLSMEGGNAVNVSLPDDASNFRIVGGSYRIANNTALVVAGASGFTTFSFSTALFTAKADSGWKLLFSPPQGAEVRIYAPPYATIENVFPQPKSVSSEDSRLIIETTSAKQVTVYYRLGEPPPPPAQPDYMIVIIVTALLLVVVTVSAKGMQSIFSARLQVTKPSAPAGGAERPPTLEVTPGKKDMMETFNENDLKIVSYLLGSGGKCRRNELERKTSISKSSLTMALNRLEKRKIIEIDRTSTTHFVKLSDYFLRL